MEEKYRLSHSIFNRFLDTERDYQIYSYDPKNDDNNWTYCSLCQQRLLSKHYLLGAKKMKKGEPINYDEINNIYGDLVSNTYICKINGEPIYTMKSITECAHDWVSQGNVRCDGIVKYFLAYYT